MDFKFLFISYLWGFVPDDKQKHLRELRVDAASYSKLGNYSKAEATIKKALEIDSSSKLLNHELAKIYLKSKQYENSLVLLNQISSTTSAREIIFKDIGVSYLGLGKLEKALEALDKALGEKEDYLEALVAKGKTLRELGKYEDSQKILGEALSINPKDRDALYQKGKTLHIIGKNREALDLFEKVLKFRPRDTEVLAAKGIAHDELNEFKEASDSIQKSLSVEDEVVYNDRGVALSRLGYNHKAIDSYRRALYSNPKYAVCWFNLGKALFRVGDLKEALKAFKRSTELNPNNRSAWNNRGVTLRQLNKLEESLDCYDRAIKLKKDYSWAWHNKGYVLELLDRPREALECYNYVLKHEPDHREHGVDEWKKLKEDTTKAIERIKKIVGD